MTDDRTPRARLEDLAGAEVPEPRPAFVEDLEARLVAGPSPLLAAAPAAGRRVRPAAIAVAAAVAVAIGVTGVVLAAGGTDPARVATGGTPRVALPTSAPPRAADDEPVPSSTTTTRPERPSTTTSPAAQAPSTTSTAPPEPAPTMRLVARCADEFVGLGWSAFEGEGFSAYLVLRAPQPDRPRYPRTAGDTTQQVAAVRDRDAPFHRETTSGSVSYLVVTVDRQGRELARSNVASCPPVAGEQPDGRP